jgi:hypothetical protein
MAEALTLRGYAEAVLPPGDKVLQAISGLPTRNYDVSLCPTCACMTAASAPHINTDQCTSAMVAYTHGFLDGRKTEMAAG